MSFARLVLLVLVFTGCVPSAARTNARLYPGFDLGLVGGPNMLLAGEDELGQPTYADVAPDLEADLQYALTKSDGSGMAVQLKVPALLLASVVDLYYQFPSNPDGKWFYGAGAEIGLVASVYGALTFYASSHGFITLTQRLTTNVGDGEKRFLQINPQLAVGYHGRDVEIAAFASYEHALSRGINTEWRFFDDSESKDYRDRYLLVGVALRF